MDPYAQPQIQCPQCGAPAPFRGAAVSLVCEFCDSTVVRTGVDIKLVGKVSALVDNGSPIILGSRGRHHGTPFEVMGRLQVSYSRGNWNEWYVEFADGTVGWLADAQGQYSIVRVKDQSVVAGRVPTYPELDVNMVLTIDGIEAVVVDRRGGAYKGAEGQLPFEAEPGMIFHGVDLRGWNGEFISLDYGTNPNHASPVPYMGEAIDLAEVGLHPLRQFEGWRFTGWQGQPGPT
ncbi:MAG: DUF4178 domain-containing protein [Deltaproteobacteria bacterium]|nr:DUF4178 domain-containing protein [Deltaproteobacteria bacterium]